jgi:predicted ester cyclase
MDDTRATARRFLEAFIAGDDATLSEVVADHVTDHNPLPGQPPGRDGIVHAGLAYRTGLPDLTATIHRQLSDDDLVFQHGIATGTNTGPLFGNPATGRPATIAWMDLYRIADRRVVEIWHLEDVVGMLGQLGLLPSGGESPR